MCLCITLVPIGADAHIGAAEMLSGQLDKHGITGIKNNRIANRHSFVFNISELFQNNDHQTPEHWIFSCSQIFIQINSIFQAEIQII